MADPGVAPRAVMVVLLVGWFLLEVRQSRRTRPDGTPADQGSLWVLRASTLVAFLAAGFVATLVPGAGMPQRPAAWAPVLLIATGAALRLWSFHALGLLFTFTVQVSEDQPVIEDGPYRLVRHPAYLGMLIALTGVASLMGNWLALLVFEVITLVGLAYRIRVEEAALSGMLGPRWSAYAARTRRLIPFVW